MGSPLFKISSALLRACERFAFMHWINCNISMSSGQSLIVFLLATYIASLRALREPNGSKYITRMIRLTGDGPAFVRFATATNAVEVRAVLEQYRGVSLSVLISRHCARVFSEMKWPILLSVLVPLLIRKFKLRTARAPHPRDDKRTEGADSIGQAENGAEAVPIHGLWDDARLLVRELSRESIAVVAMPASFWILMHPLVGEVLGGFQPHSLPAPCACTLRLHPVHASYRPPSLPPRPSSTGDTHPRASVSPRSRRALAPVRVGAAREP